MDVTPWLLAAAGGIGRAIATALTQAGARVIVTGRDAAALRETVASGAAADSFAADATDAQAMADGIHAAAPDGIDILIANAGGAESRLFRKADAGHFRRMIDLNLMSVVHAANAVLNGMVAQSPAHRRDRLDRGAEGYLALSADVAAKHAVVGLVRALALETAKHGVTVNAVCPAYTETAMLRDDVRRAAEKSGRDTDAMLQTMRERLPIGRLVQPQEVAAAVLFLCSADAAAITAIRN